MTGDSVFTVLGDNEAGWEEGNRYETKNKLDFFFCLCKFHKRWCRVLTVLCHWRLHSIVSILKDKSLVYSHFIWSKERNESNYSCIILQTVQMNKPCSSYNIKVNLYTNKIAAVDKMPIAQRHGEVRFYSTFITIYIYIQNRTILYCNIRKKNKCKHTSHYLDKR